jgi:hypothetical protein
MSYTTVTITDTAQYPDGIAIPYAVVVAWPKLGFANGGTTTNGSSTIASSTGAFTLAINATDDAGTAAIDPNDTTGKPSYHVLVFDAKSGEHVYDADVQVPHANASPTLAQLVVI